MCKIRGCRMILQRDTATLEDAGELDSAVSELATQQQSQILPVRTVRTGLSAPRNAERGGVGCRDTRARAAAPLSSSGAAVWPRLVGPHWNRGCLGGWEREARLWVRQRDVDGVRTAWWGVTQLGWDLLGALGDGEQVQPL